MSLLRRNKGQGGQMQRRSGYPMDRFRSDIDKLFNRFMEDFMPEEENMWRYPVSGFGAVTDLAETDKELTVKVELPGVDPKDVDVSVEGNMLRISGEKKEQQEEKDKHYYYTERQFGSFQRNIQLPESADADNVNADFKDGVLTVTVPKKAESQAKRIEVNSE